MSDRLANHLMMARQRRFVGRDGMLDLFRSALAATDLPFHVLFLFGVGGVGKTTLLREFARLCTEGQTPAISVDARNIQPSPAALVDALRRAMNLMPSDSPVEVLASQSARYVLLIDTYEMLAPLDGWMRETFLPQLPNNTLVVLAGRDPPALAWLTDPGWASMVRSLRLDNLSPEESCAYLTQREVPVDQQQDALAFTHGHPLALALVADVIAQRPGIRFQPETMPDVLKVLLQQFQAQLPSSTHRAALEACSVVRVMTQPLLAEMLAVPDAHMLFEWLREVSFIEAGPFGLYPHDLAREVLAADLRWRDPDSNARLRRRGGAYFIQRLQQSRDWEQERLLFDLLFLHRDSPVLRPLFERIEWQARSGVFADAVRESDVPEIVAMVAQHEGGESARLAAHWLERQLDQVLVFREIAPDAAPALAGFVMWLALHEANADDVNADPATRSAWQYVQRHAPLRPGEGALYRRFEMARDTYQGPSPIQSLNIVDWERRLLTTPWPGPVFKAYADPDFWTPMLAYAEVRRIPECDFDVGERCYAVYGLDTRVLPTIARWRLLTERLVDSGAQAPEQPPVTRHIGGLSQPEFAAAVRDALRTYAHPDRLRSSPLLQSRLVRARAGAGETERIAACRSLLQAATDTLQSSPRQGKWYRALYHTYLHPAPTQEKAAELLDVPFSTFRRHLQAGVSRVTEVLWQWELSASEQ